MGSQYCRTNRETSRSTKAFILDDETIFLENALFKIESSLLFDENKFKIS
jgi:hypothetical protein